MNENEKAAREGDKTLTERGSIYGSYPAGLEIRENILNVIKRGYQEHHGIEMQARHESYFWDIANKLSRLAICPTHEDSWHDIVGYGKLIEASVKEENGND